MKKIGLLLLTSLLILGGACSENGDEPTGINSFRVTIVEGETGSNADRVPFPEDPVQYVLDIRALDFDGKVDKSYDGKVAISVQPAGALGEDTPSRVAVENGVAERVEIELERCHGDVTIWVEDAGGVDTSGSYAVGASPVLHFAYPTIAQMQRWHDFESSALRGDFVELRVADRNVVVTNIRRDGFYCQDLDEGEGEHGGVYVYTHNRPDGVIIGSKLIALRGQVSEFFGFTELGFPDYVAAPGQELALPDPAVIDVTLLADDEAMEGLESSLVAVTDVLVCPLDEQYTLYDQWPVLVDPNGSCYSEEGAGVILVAETGGYDEIDPPSLEGTQLRQVTGTLRYHYLATPSWMIIPRSADDVR